MLRLQRELDSHVYAGTPKSHKISCQNNTFGTLGATKMASKPSEVEGKGQGQEKGNEKGAQKGWFQFGGYWIPNHLGLGKLVIYRY